MALKLPLNGLKKSHERNLYRILINNLKPKCVIFDVEFHIFGHSLKPVSSVKLLAVKIDERLSFNTHISALCAKASHQINALHHIVEYLILENRVSVYNIDIAAPSFICCNTVWHFCSNRSLYKLEKLHKQALGAVLNDYSSSYCDPLDPD